MSSVKTTLSLAGEADERISRSVVAMTLSLVLSVSLPKLAAHQMTGCGVSASVTAGPTANDANEAEQTAARSLR